MVSSSDSAFCSGMRHEAARRGVTILVVGGQSGVGKSHLIKELLQCLDGQYVAVYDLAWIRDMIMSTQRAVKQSLYDLYSCSYTSREHFSPQLCRRMHRSPKAFLTYCEWLKSVCAPVIMADWCCHYNGERILILELMSPIDIEWELADLHVFIRPPTWCIDTQLMRRERMTRFAAMAFRRLQEEVIKLSLASRTPYTPDLVIADSGISEAVEISRILRKRE